MLRQKNDLLGFAAAVLAICLAILVLAVGPMLKELFHFLKSPVYYTGAGALSEQKINGLVFLIENEDDIEGILKWEKELDKRGFSALIKAEKVVMEKYPSVFKILAGKGYEIAIGYSEQTCWDMSYEQQYQIMKEYLEFGEAFLKKPVRVFSCRYFSYDENTLKAADELGLEYLLARGTQDIRAVIYEPQEYSVKLISVSNIEFEDMGRGSLCDISLWARGATGEDFYQLFEETAAKEPDSMILVSHAHLGGTKKDWWLPYEMALDNSKVAWASFDAWLGKTVHLALPNAEIPINREVKYVEPKPAVTMEELELIDELKEKIVMYHNNSGSMCLEAKDFLETLSLPLEEHLINESGFYEELWRIKSYYGQSEGVSQDFGFYPIILIKNRVFSGFNQEVKNEISNLVK